MAAFTSRFTSLILQDEVSVWAHFEDGKFETDDEALAERLRSAEDVEEVTEAPVKPEPESDPESDPESGDAPADSQEPNPEPEPEPIKPKRTRSAKASTETH